MCCVSRIVSAVLADESTPSYYVEDDGAAGGNGAIRAISSTGQQQWIWPTGTSTRSPILAAADDQGGAIYFANNDTENQFQSCCYLGRVDENGNETWQYQMTNGYEDYAVHPDIPTSLRSGRGEEGHVRGLLRAALRFIRPNNAESLHAKCVVVDEQRLFVSSANFTEAAQERNIEIGLVLDSAVLAIKVSGFFENLVETGFLKRFL